MRLRNLLVGSLLLVSAGCGGAQTSRATAIANACDELDASTRTAAVFDAPLTVVSAERVYTDNPKPFMRDPRGIAVDVRAEPGMDQPYLHRVVTCRLGATDGRTSVAVQSRGPVYRVTVTSDQASTARDLFAQLDSLQTDL
ncbi:hypothetical protein [Sandaracinus amylolyticus]|uniref:hypothetical protein n=1 Tax=Sandaracinus amylolyticus TaxID=927083 RepID=UPI001F32EA01|nr:hypothetical protein [Sandaracinus amylolyticus]UJR79665.1 Hypothetical protein I5071_17030 [Sandaracinus amylolyticus]